jgi:hypothetical protein
MNKKNCISTYVGKSRISYVYRERENTYLVTLYENEALTNTVIYSNQDKAESCAEDWCLSEF